MQLAADEDQASDADRVHVSENVGYLVFDDTEVNVEDLVPSGDVPAETTLDQVNDVVDQAIALWDANGACPNWTGQSTNWSG